MRSICRLGFPIGLLLLCTDLCASPILGQIDTFSGSTLGWDTGTRGPTQPAVISSGGPGGAGDGFLQLTSDGSGSDGRLTVFNRDQWTGNFLAAGVNAVEMDVKNFGSSSLSIRVGLKSATTQGAPGYASSTAFALAADAQWHHAVFLLDQADLTAVGSAPALNSLLANVAEFRILNAAAPRLNGDSLLGQLGIDNIKADTVSATAAVPEPSPHLLLTVGAVLLFLVTAARSHCRRVPAHRG
jgi:hypothetical protein